MPLPAHYEHASDHFFRFLDDARERAELCSTHLSYTMTQCVLQTFRRRLSTQQAIDFANALPICLRALFVSDWDTNEPIWPFADRETMNKEVCSLRAGEAFSSDSAIRDVAVSLRRHVDEEAFDRMLAGLPQGAVEFWAP